jgi:hypothetical protein
MSISPLPTPLQQLGGRRFSFYPPILNIPHNEWIYRRAGWAEFVVVNTESGEEACIPRTFLGDVSLADSVGVPAVIVGLKRELEWNAGRVSPRRRPVIELPVDLPRAVNDVATATPSPHHRATVVNIRLEPQRDVRTLKKIGVALMLGSMVLLIVADVARHMQMRQRADVFRISRSWLQLTPADDYASVVRKLGTPASDGTLRTPEGVSWRVLTYPGREFRVVLAGSAAPHYMGTLDLHGRVLGAVSLPDGSSAAQLLRAVPTF